MIGGGMRAAAQALRPLGRQHRRLHHLATLAQSRLSVSDKPNTWEEITTYNNFFRFGLDKSDPFENSRDFRSRPWSVEIAGECDVKGKFALEDILKPARTRGARLPIPLRGGLVADRALARVPARRPDHRFRPNSRARYVVAALLDPKQMPDNAAAYSTGPIRSAWTRRVATGADGGRGLRQGAA
jgi:sulfoxide reductase catalytic subunit YedY